MDVVIEIWLCVIFMYYVCCVYWLVELYSMDCEALESILTEYFIDSPPYLLIHKWG